MGIGQGPRMIVHPFLKRSVLLFWGMAVVLPAFATAQSLDVIAPRLHHSPPPFPVRIGREIEVTAEVSDNIAVKSVWLFYRKKGVTEYSGILLKLKEGDEKKGVYTVVISRIETGSEGLEYYFAAEDGADNRTLKGEALRPLFLEIRPPLEDVKRQFELLKFAWERENLFMIGKLSDLPENWEKVLSQIFEYYSSITLEIAVDEKEMTDEGASALFTFKTLVDPDGSRIVLAPGWSKARLRLLFPRNKDGTWKKIIWE